MQELNKSTVEQTVAEVQSWALQLLHLASQNLRKLWKNAPIEKKTRNKPLVNWITNGHRVARKA
jgi:hypothetical protein